MITISQAERLQDILRDLESWTNAKMAEEKNLVYELSHAIESIKRLLAVRASSPKNSDGDKAWKIINLWYQGTETLIREWFKNSQPETSMDVYIPVARKTTTQ